MVMRDLIVKRLSFLLVTGAIISLIIYSSCSLDIPEDNRRKVIGEGPVVTKSIPAENFKYFQHLAFGSVLLVTGDSLDITINAQQNIIDEMDFNFGEESFVWRFKDEIDIVETDTIYLTIKIPNEIEAVLVAGTGRIVLSGDKQESIDLEVIGLADLLCYDLEVDYCELYISGTALCRIFVNEEISGYVTGIADIYYKGEPQIDVIQSGQVSFYNEN
jgi:hypothetical protein